MLKISQEELKKYYHEWKIFVFNYKRVYQIRYNSNTKKFNLMELEKEKLWKSEFSYTKKWRYHVFDRKYAEKLLKK